jgi:hypothetical protein
MHHGGMSNPRGGPSREGESSEGHGDNTVGDDTPMEVDAPVRSSRSDSASTPGGPGGTWLAAREKGLPEISRSDRDARIRNWLGKVASGPGSPGDVSSSSSWLTLGDPVDDATYGIPEMFRRVDQCLLEVDQALLEVELGEGDPNASLDQLEAAREQLEAVRQDFSKDAVELQNLRTALEEKEEKLGALRTALNEAQKVLEENPWYPDEPFQFAFKDEILSYPNVNGLHDEIGIREGSVKEAYKKIELLHENKFARWRGVSESDFREGAELLLDSRKTPQPFVERDVRLTRARNVASQRAAERGSAGSERSSDQGIDFP